jgi:hypothetical protein
VSDIIPTAEDAASALNELQYENYVVNPRLTLAIVGPIARPLLEAIAAGRVFEVRPERCAMCLGYGGRTIDIGTPAEYWNDCGRCDGSGFEPAPPGRKQRTAYDALIEAAAEAGTLDDF